MAQFDVYRNSGTYTGIVPYLVDVQSDILSNFDTRVVIPLQSADFIRSENITVIARLNPAFTVCDTEVFLAPQQMAAVHKRELGSKVDTLEAMRMEIFSALDVLAGGI
jgi:toxin CcdB